jgi:DnaJ-class molecular chaperone
VTLPQRDFYQVLGIARDASPAQIRAAYIHHAKRHHPDLAPHGALPGRLHEVQQAYRCLSDNEARANHDRVLRENEALHAARQRSVQRHLRRYDRRHAHPPPRIRRRLAWRPLLVVAVGVAVLAWLSHGAAG